MLLLNNGIKEMIHKNPDQRLEGKFWSSLIDECIDRSTTKVYATFVQFQTVGQGIECVLYRLAECSDKSNSKDLFEMFDSIILSKPFGKQLRAFANDGAR